MAKVNFTAARVQGFQCPEGKAQAFLWDSKAPGLALRATATGAKAYIFQARLKTGGTVRITLGAPLGCGGAWSIPAAQEQALRLQMLVDQGRDPRVDRSEQAQADLQVRAEVQLQRRRSEVTGLHAWEAYCEDRREAWGARNHADHLAFSREGGQERARAPGKKVQPGPLRPLLARPLMQIDRAAVQAWVTAEAKTRPARARLGFRQLRAFIRWCGESDEYKELVCADACAGTKTRERLGRQAKRVDALQREQLRDWFSAVRSEPNRVASAYLQALLLTGARREELAGVRWDDVNFDPRVRSVRIRDKVDGERVIPLTPYVAHLLADLPRVNEWVFSTTRMTSRKAAAKAGKTPVLVNASATGRLVDARAAHVRALDRAGLPHTSLHGLRRSFKSLSEWCEVPVGVVAQLMGHKPSATAEKHYTVRPLDLLRKWHTSIEAWALEQAGIEFKEPDQEQRPGLRLVGTAA